MTAETKLWPDFNFDTRDDTVKTMLEAAARELDEITKGKLTLEIRSTVKPVREKAARRVPHRGDNVYANPTEYPPTLKFNRTHHCSFSVVGKEFKFPLLDIIENDQGRPFPATLRTDGANDVEIPDREALENTLKKIFSAPATRHTVESLVMMADTRKS